MQRIRWKALRACLRKQIRSFRLNYLKAIKVSRMLFSSLDSINM